MKIDKTLNDNVIKYIRANPTSKKKANDIFDVPMDMTLNHFIMYKATKEMVDEFMTYVLITASKEGDVEYLKLLLEGGADPNVQDEHEWTALHWAAFKREGECVDLLLKYGADPNARNKHGETAFRMTSKMSYIDCIKLLKEHNK